MTARFSRSLPARPDLEQQKTLAKELLGDFRKGDAEALARVREQLPDKPSIALADAQYVLAREYGFASWAELRRHIGTPSPSSPTPTPVDAMRHAIGTRNIREMRRLLEQHADLRAAINEPVFSFGSTALLHLSGCADLELIDLLLEFGADPNRRSDWWAGPFHVLHSATGEVAERLIAAGAIPDACAAANLDRPDLLIAMIDRDPACVHERGGDGQTPLHFARSRAVIDLLLDAGADIDARDIDHRSTAAEWMLDHARERGRYNLAAYLVERGTTADIFLAAALGLTDRARELLSQDRSLLDLRCTQGDYAEKPPSSYHVYMWSIGADLTPLQVAAQFEQHETLAAMRAAASSRHLMVSALARADAGEANALLRAEPDLLQKLSPDDRRVLPDAGWSGNTRAVELMLQLGIDPATPNHGGATVLHNASFEGEAECVAVILRHPRARELLALRDTVYGATPVGWCFYGSRHGPKADHATVARLLFQAGGRPDPEHDFDDPSPQVRAVIEEFDAAP